MRAVQLKIRTDGRKNSKWARGTPSRGNSRSGSGQRMPGLRWVPIPLAVLAAAVGWLVLGSLQGQFAAASAQGRQAGGLGLAVDQMLWMSNDMTGQGPHGHVAPKGYQMPANMMPGMQTGSNDRLRVEVSLRNLTSDVQRYAMSDFTVVAPGGQSWKVNGNGRSVSARAGTLEPGFEVTIDMYFDIPAAKIKHLTLKWSRDGSTVSIPVNTGGAGPGRMRM